MLRFQSPPVESGLEVREKLLTYNWPGNVRELKNAAERHALGLPLLTLAEDQEESAVKSTGSLKSSLHAIERMLLESALQESHCNLQTVCSRLDMNLSSLYRKLNDHHIDLDSLRGK